MFCVTEWVLKHLSNKEHDTPNLEQVQHIHCKCNEHDTCYMKQWNRCNTYIVNEHDTCYMKQLNTCNTFSVRMKLVTA
jgi:hypothetical protein